MSTRSAFRRLRRGLYPHVVVPTNSRLETFRDWAAEKADHPREVIEAALAHVVQNKVEAAYARSDLFERRRLLMDDWATRAAVQRTAGPEDETMTLRFVVALLIELAECDDDAELVDALDVASLARRLQH